MSNWVHDTILLPICTFGFVKHGLSQQGKSFQLVAFLSFLVFCQAQEMFPEDEKVSGLHIKAVCRHSAAGPDLGIVWIA